MTGARPDIWTEERLADLVRLRKVGVSITRIGEALGVSRNSVASKVARMGLPKKDQAESLRKATAVRRGEIPAKPAKPTKRKRPMAGRAGRLLAELPVNACRWPIGDTKEPDFEFCGEHAGPGRSYCERHHGKAYTRIAVASGGEA